MCRQPWLWFLTAALGAWFLNPINGAEAEAASQFQRTEPKAKGHSGIEGLEIKAQKAFDADRHEEALRLYEQLIATRRDRKDLPQDDAKLAVWIYRSGCCFGALGRDADALPNLEEALAMQQRLFKGDHPDVATSINNVAGCLSTLNRSAEALPKFQEALAMRRRLFKGDHPDVATSLNNVANCIDGLGRSAEALPKFEEALAVQRRLFAGDHTDLATTLNNFAMCLGHLGNGTEALPKLQEALAMRQRLFKGDHPDVARSLDELAICLGSIGRMAEAQPKREEELAMLRRLFKGDHPDVARALSSVGAGQFALGQQAEALANFEVALPMLRRLFHGDHQGVAAALANIGSSLDALGRSAEALPKYEEALAMQRRLFRGDHPNVADSLGSIALCLSALGRNADALRRLEEALAMRRRLFKGDHPDVASSLNSIAYCLSAMDRPAEALPNYESALTMQHRLLKGDHPDIAGSLNNVATCLETLDRSADALPKYVEALAMNRRLFREDHPVVASSLENLARCLDALNRSAEAFPRHMESLSTYRRLYPEGHPILGQHLENLGFVDFVRGQGREAYGLLAEAEKMLWRLLARELGSMTETQRRQFRSSLGFVQRPVLWSLVFGGQVTNTEAGLRSLLLRKNLLTEAARVDQAALQAADVTASPEWRRQWERRQDLRRQIANLPSNPPDGLETGTNVFSGERMTPPGRALEELEATLRQGNTNYARNARLGELTVADVRRALRPGEGLVEYAVYEPLVPEVWTNGPARYGVVVAFGDGSPVRVVDLGPAAVIDTAVRAYSDGVRTRIEKWKGVIPSDPQVREAEQAAGQTSSRVRELVWEPLKLAGLKRVYVGPDGALGLLPFEALARADGSSTNGWRYLVEDLEVVHLNTARDLARLALTSGEGQTNRTAVLVGNPDFNFNGELAAVAQSPMARVLGRSPTLGGGDPATLSRSWAAVPTTGAMVDAVAGQLKELGWQVAAYQGAAATEAQVLGLRRPRLLQFGTHGAVLAPGETNAAWDNPLLRSMLLLAGANRRGATNLAVGDGVLTAYEVSGMDLQGTELVNLTACETGLGQVTDEGISGLRQAFLLAGARSVTVSLWEVPADEMPEQTRDFYQRWLGRGANHAPTRYGAFRAAQLASLARTRQARGAGHPYHWAGVIYLGDPGDLPATAHN